MNTIIDICVNADVCDPEKLRVIPKSESTDMRCIVFVWQDGS